MVELYVHVWYLTDLTVIMRDTIFGKRYFYFMYIVMYCIGRGKIIFKDIVMCQTDDD